jgi:hypothetical protein
MFNVGLATTERMALTIGLPDSERGGAEEDMKMVEVHRVKYLTRSDPVHECVLEH